MDFTTSFILNITIFITIITFILYKLSIRNFDYWKRKGVPYVKPLPFVGNFLDVITLRSTFGHFLAKLYNQFPTPYFGMYIFNTPYLVIRSPDLIKLILVKDFNQFYDHAMLCDEKYDSIASKTLTFTHNPEWKLLRTKLSPAFTTGKMKSMFGQVKEVSEEMNGYLFKNMSKDSIEVKEVCAKFTTDVIAICQFGIRANSFQCENAEFRQVARQIFGSNWKATLSQTSYFIAQSLVKLFGLRFFEPKPIDFFRNMFWETIAKRELAEGKRNDLIDTLIEIKKTLKGDIKFEGDLVVAQLIGFFLAGSETTSSTMAFTLYELSLQIKIQDKLRSEIKNVLSKHQGFSYEAIRDMKYLNMVVCETLRKYPIFPFLDRKAKNDYKVPESDLLIEKGTPIYFPLFGLHYDPEFFPDPEKFDPDRFSDENKTFPSCAYIPFGIGPRNCIAERFGLLITKLGLAHILSEYEVEKTADTPVPLIFDTSSLVPASTIGLPIKFRKFSEDTVQFL